MANTVGCDYGKSNRAIMILCGTLLIAFMGWLLISFQSVKADTTAQLNTFDTRITNNHENVQAMQVMAARMDERLVSIVDELRRINDKLEAQANANK